ncbi:LOW QUALITY PROTEIN: F-box and leucine-rich repeat protein 13 [Sylvia borin]
MRIEMKTNPVNNPRLSLIHLTPSVLITEEPLDSSRIIPSSCEQWVQSVFSNGLSVGKMTLDHASDTSGLDFYSRNLMKLYFGAWIKYNLLEKNEKKKPIEDSILTQFQLISVGIWITFLMYVRCVTCTLNISTGNNQNTNLIFKMMSKCCPYIRHIHVADCQKITAGVQMISPLKHILVVNMADCTGTRFLYQCKGIFCKGTEHLEQRHASDCPQLPDEAVKATAFHCHRLTSAKVAGCPKMIDTCIQYLAAACHHLPFLDISGCIHLTDNLKCLWKGCEQLQILTTLYCRKVTKKIFPNLNSEVQRHPTLYFARPQNILAASRRNDIQKIKGSSQIDSAELEKQERNDADPPSWLGYAWDGNITPSPKNTYQSLKKQVFQNEK